MTTVELHPAFSWDCDRCGRENFTRGVRVSLSAEELEELREEFEIDPAAVGEFLGAPDQVECTHCGSQFDAETS